MIGQWSQQRSLLLENRFLLLRGDKVHFVDKAEDLRFRRILKDGVQAGLVVMNVLLLLVRIHVENVDENLNVSKDVVSLVGQVVLHESFLTATVPKVEYKASQKTDVRVLHIDCEKHQT